VADWRLRLRLACVALLLAGSTAAEVSGARARPALRPNLSDAVSEGFDLLVGEAPFEVVFTLENVEGYAVRWEGDETPRRGDAPTRVLRFDQAGEHYAVVHLSAPGRRSVTLSQKVVVLSGDPAPSLPGKDGVNQDLVRDRREHVALQVPLMAAAGVQWVRMPIRWFTVEPERDAYTWTAVDPVVDQVTAAGMEVLAVLGSTPSWASGVARGEVPEDAHWDAYEPTSVADFARYAHAVASHYRGRIRAYEIFNEPNTPTHWRPWPDAQRFVEFLCAGYAAVKYADPSHVVVVGGLNGNGLTLGWETPEGRDFLKAIYAGPGRHCFDVMAIHPFAHPVADGLPTLQAWVDQTRGYMRAQGDARELWLTEVGWSTGPNLWGHPTISEAQQADWVEAIYRDLIGPEKVFWYNFKDTRRHSTDPEHRWGWLHFDLEPKPAYERFKAVAGGD
jgi:hypothetical protein